MNRTHPPAGWGTVQFRDAQQLRRAIRFVVTFEPAGGYLVNLFYLSEPKPARHRRLRTSQPVYSRCIPPCIHTPLCPYA